MLICWLILSAAANVDIDDASECTSFLQLRKKKNGTKLWKADGDAGLPPHDRGAVSATRQVDAATARHRRHRHRHHRRHAQRLHAHETHRYEGRELGSLFQHKVSAATCSVDPASTAGLLVDQVNVIRHNLDYRVGDVITKGGFFWKESRKQLLTPPYAGTALQTMLAPCAARADLTCNLSLKDFRTALEKVGRIRGFAKPDRRTVVVYVRAGDVLGPCEERADSEPTDYRGDEVAAGLRDPFVKGQIASAMASGYNRVNFVVVESYADRADAGKNGYWMYSDKKHEENRWQLRTAFQQIIEELCFVGKEIAFGVVSFVNVDETMYYLMHAATLVTEKTRVANHGFPWITAALTKMQNTSAAIIIPQRGPEEYPACSGIL